MRPCIIVGNGPSLADTPSEILRDYATFSTGRINLYFRDKDWRPTYYVLSEKMRKVDEPRLRLDFREIFDRTSVKGYIQFGMWPLIRSNLRDGRVQFFKTCAHALDDGPPDRWHLPEICSYGSSVHAAIQYAIMLWYDPIYLVGCDISGGHFVRDYGDSVTEPEFWIEAHELAKRSSPVPIYNATIGGTLEVYERVDIEELRKCQ